MPDKNSNTSLATFAGGCFWCMEPVFRIYPGVASAIVGYTGGDKPNPTYVEVSSGLSGHREGIQVQYDPQKIKYEFLLKIFLHNIDPTDAGGQFHDRGTQYQTAIYFHDEEQKRLAQTALKDLAASGKFDKTLAVQLLPYKNFYPAEEYHQGYYKKNPVRYQAYHEGSGRDNYLARVWDTSSDPHK
ncbi:MAG TPA: peptide-methionine (S)-S-oxide reductase MsrA [Patescibacteria group bacterium]|nr:peptide-methionine (S)-S-oxide reductase MsrA [Patescibacteria group bacterium]